MSWRGREDMSSCGGVRNGRQKAAEDTEGGENEATKRATLRAHHGQDVLTQPPGPPALHSPAPLHVHEDSPAINLLAICVLVSGCNRCGEGKGRSPQRVR